MRRIKQSAEVVDRSVHRMYVQVVGDIVAVVPQRRREKGQKPEACDTQIANVIDFLNEPGEIADAVAVAVKKCPHVHLIEDGVFVPQRIGCTAWLLWHVAFLRSHAGLRDSGRKTTIPNGGSVTFKEYDRP